MYIIRKLNVQMTVSDKELPGYLAKGFKMISHVDVDTEAEEAALDLLADRIADKITSDVLTKVEELLMRLLPENYNAKNGDGGEEKPADKPPKDIKK